MDIAEFENKYKNDYINMDLMKKVLDKVINERGLKVLHLKRMLKDAEDALENAKKQSSESLATEVRDLQRVLESKKSMLGTLEAELRIL
jgi:predicted nuclease with TOPRIM domain